MGTVTIDDQDYADLVQRVQRAEGLLAGVAAELKRHIVVAPQGAKVLPEGDLRRMFDQGVHKSGDQYKAFASGKNITAVINDVGALVVSGDAYAGPSPAMKAVTGTQQNGFAKFLRASDGVSMHVLRNQAREREGLPPIMWK